MAGCRWAHSACHANSDPANSSASLLLLADYLTRPLTVLDLGRMHLDGAELAFLSACATARTSTELSDEAIHLASACQLAGYRQVIATLWPIGDVRAVRISAHIYSSLAEGRSPAAAALHQAVLRRRNLDPEHPSTWAAHTHNGA